MAEPPVAEKVSLPALPNMVIEEPPLVLSAPLPAAAADDDRLGIARGV